MKRREIALSALPSPPVRELRAPARARRELDEGPRPLLTFREALAWMNDARATLTVRDRNGIVTVDIRLGTRTVRATVLEGNFREAVILLASGLRDDVPSAVRIRNARVGDAGVGVTPAEVSTANARWKR